MPQQQDLSNASIRRVVLSESVQHPAVVYPAALGVLGGLGATVLAGAPPLWIGAATVGGLVAIAALLTNYYGRYDRIAGHYLQRVRESMESHRSAQITDLAEDLGAVGALDAQRQLNRMAQKMASFHTVLAEQLSPNELTFARFSAIAEAVFVAGIDNLRSVHLAHRALQGIDETYLSERLAAADTASGAAEDPAAQGMRSQLEQARTLRERIKTLLGQNELAMAELDRSTGALGEMTAGSNRPSLDMESAMQEMTRIAKRSREYSMIGRSN